MTMNSTFYLHINCFFLGFFANAMVSVVVVRRSSLKCLMHGPFKAGRRLVTPTIRNELWAISLPKSPKVRTYGKGAERGVPEPSLTSGRLIDFIWNNPQALTELTWTRIQVNELVRGWFGIGPLCIRTGNHVLVVFGGGIQRKWTTIRPSDLFSKILVFTLSALERTVFVAQSWG